MKVRPKFADCLHCRRAVPTFDYFMLREEVWLLVHTTNRGMMHLECVEERLGRTLRRTDFATQERINGMMCHLSPLLRSRYSPSRQELRRGAADFVTLLAKHEDVLIRLLKVSSRRPPAMPSNSMLLPSQWPSSINLNRLGVTTRVGYTGGDMPHATY